MPKTFAVGDIHGCRGKLRNLIALIEHEAAGEAVKLVFLGDYIDRGADSHGVIEDLMALPARLRGEVVFLTGNHEALALAAAENSADAAAWLSNGGDATLRSYGVAAAAQLPAAHIAWLRALTLMHDDGRRLFVHAGVDPIRPLDRQDPYDLIWIREPFLSATRDYGRLVVHGHTPVRTGQPDLRADRLNIDTGAVYGGPLTAAVFSDERTEPSGFLQADE